LHVAVFKVVSFLRECIYSVHKNNSAQRAVVAAENKKCTPV